MQVAAPQSPRFLRNASAGGLGRVRDPHRFADVLAQVEREHAAAERLRLVGSTRVGYKRERTAPAPLRSHLLLEAMGGRGPGSFATTAHSAMSWRIASRRKIQATSLV